MNMSFETISFSFQYLLTPSVYELTEVSFPRPTLTSDMLVIGQEESWIHLAFILN